MKRSGAVLLKLLGSMFIISLLVGCSTMNSWVSFLWDGGESQKAQEDQARWRNFGKSISPISPTTDHYRKGRYFQQKKKYTLAIEAYRDVLKNNPCHIEALNAMGVAYDQLGEYLNAEIAFKAAFELDTHRADITNNLGYCYLLQNNMPAAIEMFKMAVILDAASAIYSNNLGLAYARTTQYPLAFQEFKKSQGREKAFRYLQQVISKYGLSNQSEQYRLLAKSFQQAETTTSIHQGSDTQTTTTQLKKLRDKLLQPEEATPPTATNPDQADPITAWASDKPTPLSEPVPESAAGDNSYDEDFLDLPPVSPAEIEISNGNGVNGMAHLVGNFLSKRSFPIKRLTNASRFTFATSTIFYCPGYAHDAHDVESQIPGDQQVDEVKELGRPNIKVRVRLGNDVINKRHFFKQSIMTAEAGFLDRENRTKINTSM